MTQFSDRPLYVEAIRGVRSFDVDRLGRLTGVSYQRVFKPGENVAECSDLARAHATLQHAVRRMGERVQWAYTTPRAIGGPAPQPSPAPEPEHHTAGKGCTCGFYAYFDGGNDYAKQGRVTGIIEGTGCLTVGDRGFRAEKARLVALVDPRKRQRRSWRIYWAFAIFLALWAVVDALTGNWIAAGVAVGIAALDAGFGFITWRARPKVSPALDFERVHANYPDVPVYRTLIAALADFPLTPPEPVTPETADDFWEREA